MNNTIIILSVLTVLFFFGCVKTYKISGKVFVEGMGFRSIEFYWFIILLISFFTYLLFNDIGKWVLLGYYLLWFIMLFMNHWRYVIFGVTEIKLKGYNKCFKNTIKLFQASDKHLVPDLYHILLSVIVLLNLILLILT